MLVAFNNPSLSAITNKACGQRIANVNRIYTFKEAGAALGKPFEKYLSIPPRNLSWRI